MSQTRDHLFISYAYEDIAFAEWLELKLVAAGYRVWRDGSKLLGGEPYPREIDQALKTRTSRVLAVLSHDSIRKPNPTKERTLALNLGKERNEQDFLIPINLVGLSPGELDWMTSDLSFIPFSPSWADGLHRLLRKLDSVSVPRDRTARPGALAAWLSHQAGPAIRSELLHSNAFPILTMPSALLRLECQSEGLGPHLRGVPCIRQTDTLWWTLVSPTSLPSSTEISEVPWSIDDQDIPREELERKAVRLLRLHVWQFCEQKGLRRAREEKNTYCYFHSSPRQNRRIHFTTYTGRRTSLQVTGTRRFHVGPGQTESVRYHLAPDFTPALALFDSPALILRLHLVLTDLSSKPLDPAKAHRRRRRIGKTLRNHQWFVRQLAVMEYLSDGSASLNLSADPDRPILVSSIPYQSKTTVGISNPREKALPEEPSEAEVLDSDEETGDDDLY